MAPARTASRGPGRRLLGAEQEGQRVAHGLQHCTACLALSPTPVPSLACAPQRSTNFSPILFRQTLTPHPRATCLSACLPTPPLAPLQPAPRAHLRAAQVWVFEEAVLVCPIFRHLRGGVCQPKAQAAAVPEEARAGGADVQEQGALGAQQDVPGGLRVLLRLLRLLRRRKQHGRDVQRPQRHHASVPVAVSGRGGGRRGAGNSQEAWHPCHLPPLLPSAAAACRQPHPLLLLPPALHPCTPLGTRCMDPCRANLRKSRRVPQADQM